MGRKSCRGAAWSFVLQSCAVLAACGSDGTDAVPIDDIPPDTRLVDLTGAEEQGVCNWGRGIAADELPPPGTKLDCGLTFNGFQSCGFPTSAQTGCEATVSQYRTCFPLFIHEIAQDPCQILDLSLSESRLEEFIDSIPGCEGVGACSYTTR